MGQLIIKYHSKNPGAVEIMTNVELSPDENKEVVGQAIQELILDGEVFVRKEPKGNKDEGSRGVVVK